MIGFGLTQGSKMVRFWLVCVLLTMVSSPLMGQETLMCLKGEVLFQEDFSEPKLGSGWKVAKGEWNIDQQTLVGKELKKDKHAAVVRTDVSFPSAFVVQFDFRFDGAKVLHCSFNGKGHICRARITPEGYVLVAEKDKKNSADKSVTVGQVQQSFTKGRWYTMTLEVDGNEMVGRVGKGPVAFGSNEKIGRAKTNFGFPLSGTMASIDKIKVWSAQSNPKWAATRAKLPENKIIPPQAPTAKQRFARLDKNGDGELSSQEFVNPRPKDKRPQAERQFQKRDIDKSNSLSLKEFSPSKGK